MGDLTRYYHAKSPHYLDAIGRGQMKTPHPHEIRIPDCLCSFAENHLFTQLPTGRPKTNDGKHLRGRGRGGQPSLSSSTYSAREKIIGRTLDSKEMDVKEGKDFILEKFLGQQAHNFKTKTKSTFSQSSGHSRQTCPPSFKASPEEWPELEKIQSDSTSQISNHQKNIGKSNNQNGMKPLSANPRVNSAVSDGNIRRSHSEEVLNTHLRKGKSDKGNVESKERMSEPQQTEKMENEKSGEERNEQSKNWREEPQQTEKIRMETENKETGEERNEVPTGKEGMTSEVNPDGEEETQNEINYRLLGIQQEFLPGDILPLAGPNVLQVEGLPEGITEEDVSDLFLSCGRVTACKVLRDADTKLCIGIAYVRLDESSACAMAVSSFNEETSPFIDYYEDGEVPVLNVQHFTI